MTRTMLIGAAFVALAAGITSASAQTPEAIQSKDFRQSEGLPPYHGGYRGYHHRGYGAYAYAPRHYRRHWHGW